MNRRCLNCGFSGHMDTWFKSGWAAGILICIGLTFWMVPGIVLWVWAYGRYKCPSCGRIGKNAIAMERAEEPEVYKQRGRYPDDYVHQIDINNI